MKNTGWKFPGWKFWVKSPRVKIQGEKPQGENSGWKFPGWKIRGENSQGENSQGVKYGVKIPRVKIQGENSQGVKYGVKIPRHLRVKIPGENSGWKFRVKIPTVKNTCIRVKSPRVKNRHLRVKNTGWKFPGWKFWVKSPRVKIQGENSQGENPGWKFPGCKIRGEKYQVGGSFCFHCFLQGFVRPHIAEGDKYTCQGEKSGWKIQSEKYQLGGSLCFHCFWQGFVWPHIAAKWAEVYVFTVVCKVLSDHILPRVKNTHARLKNRMKNTGWKKPSGRKFMFSMFFARFCLTTYCQG